MFNYVIYYVTDGIYEGKIGANMTLQYLLEEDLFIR